MSTIHHRAFTVRVRHRQECLRWSGGRARLTGGRCTTAPPPATAASASTRFGFFPGLETPSDRSLTPRQRFDNIAARLGTPAVYRIYFDGLPPTTFRGSKADLGVPVVLSFKADPARVASGDYDARLRSFFDSIPKDRLVWWSFFHEPEDEIEAGRFTAAQYRAAWSHLLAVVPRRSTLRSTLILMRWDLESRVRSVRSYVTPGIDVLAWDAYIRTWCPTIADAYDKAARVSASYGMGFGVAETSVDDAVTNPPARTTVVRDVVGRGRADHAQFVIWFETNKSEGDYRLLPYPAAADLWNRLT
ncbi:MAG TPA: hypothetical protein VI452_17570 [Marmoricola sp.]